MLSEYVPVLILFVFAACLVLGFVIISAVLGRKKNSTTSLDPYECGVPQASEPSRPLSIKFFIVAIVFLLFDVELALLYPWALLFRKFVSIGMGNFAVLEGLVFIGILSVGLIYIVRTKILEWK